MGKTGQPSCDDCYFSRAGLCALAGDAICPTFRAVKRGSLVPPKQPTLVPRPVPSPAPALA